MTVFEHMKSTFARDYGDVDMPPSFLVILFGQLCINSLSRFIEVEFGICFFLYFIKLLAVAVVLNIRKLKMQRFCQHGRFPEVNHAVVDDDSRS